MTAAAAHAPVLPVCRRFVTWVPGFEDVGIGAVRRHVSARRAAIEHVEELLAFDSSFALEESVLVWTVLVGTIDLATYVPELIEVVRGDEPGMLFTTPAPPRARDALTVSLALTAPRTWANYGTVGALRARKKARI